MRVCQRLGWESSHPRPWIREVSDGTTPTLYRAASTDRLLQTDQSSIHRTLLWIISNIYREPTNLFTFPSAICVGYRLHRICAITPHMVVYKHRGIQRSEEVLSPKSNAHQSDYYAYIFFGINESMPTNGRMPIRGLNCERNALAQTPNYIQSIIPRSTTLILSNIQSEATLFDDTPLKRSLMELRNLLLYYTTCPRWQVLFQLDVSSFPSLS